MPKHNRKQPKTHVRKVDMQARHVVQAMIKTLESVRDGIDNGRVVYAVTLYGICVNDSYVPWLRDKWLSKSIARRKE